MSSYSFGVPVAVVWATHIIVGIYFMYLGYLFTKKDLEEKLENEMRIHSLILFSLGILMSTYHSHLWFLYGKKSKS